MSGARTYIVRCSRPYVLPRPCDSEEDLRRFEHADLADMSPLQLFAEHHAASAALAAVVRGVDPVIVYGTGWTLAASEWLCERIFRTKDGQP